MILADGAVAATPGPAERQIAALEREVAGMGRTASRYRAWRACLHVVRVRELGDPGDGARGFLFDDGGQAGVSARRALVPAGDAPATDTDHRLLAMRAGCDSAPVPPGAGTATVATAAPPVGLSRLRAAVRRLRSVVGDFDRWESCLVEVGVSQAGSDGGTSGFLFGPPGAGRERHSALVIDRTHPDDPDYVLLGRGQGCGGGDAETDGAATLDGLQEDVEDLRTPVRGIGLLDECTFTVGIRRRGTPEQGYAYADAHGRSIRPALDLDPGDLPEVDVLAVPGEEPPGIECDEDAEERRPGAEGDDD